MEDFGAEELPLDRSPPSCLISLRAREEGGHKEEPLSNVLTRHVKQAADYNKALEKRQLWREREKELNAKHADTLMLAFWVVAALRPGGVLKSEGRTGKRDGGAGFVSLSAKRVLDAVEVAGVDKEVIERVKEKVARKFGSIDVHAATRQRIAKQKEKSQLQRQHEHTDAWMPDRYYTEELKQKTPWLNPVEFLSELHPRQREESLTPVASDSDSDSSGHKKKSKRKKEKKKRKKEKKKKLKKSRKG
ncbi:hypothetical protein ACSSS7_007413 [Eimeria intestinalis]